MSKEKYNLVGRDGNAFAILGYVRSAMKEQRFSREEIDIYSKEATQSDYVHLLGKSVEMIEECNRRERNKKQDAVEDIFRNAEKSKPNELKTNEELESIMDLWFDKYVPDYGKCETVGGELIRAFSRIFYRFYNDGDLASVGYGKETVGSPAVYIHEEFPKLKDIVEPLFLIKNEDTYEKHLNILFNAVVNYLQENPNTFNKENKYNCIEDFEDSIFDEEDEDYDEEDDDDYDELVYGSYDEDDYDEEDEDEWGSEVG